MMSTTLAAFVLSRPVVGSSRNMRPGHMSSSTPMLTRRFSPPDSPLTNSSPIMVSTTFRSPSWETTSHTRAFFSSRDVCRDMRSTAWNKRCSQTVGVPGRTTSCATYPERRRTCPAEAGDPSMQMVPSRAPLRIRPARRSRRVVFPAPEGPIRPSRGTWEVAVIPTKPVMFWMMTFLLAVHAVRPKLLTE